MNFPASCRNIALTALLTTSVISARAQSFPLPLYGPVENGDGILVARSPSIATDPTGTYPGLYLAVGGTGNDYLYVEWSSNGITGWSGKAYETLNTAYSPSVAFYNGYLWVAYISDGQDGGTAGGLMVGYTNDPSAGFTGSFLVSNLGGINPWAASSPTLAVYNGQLWVAAVDSYGDIETSAISGTPPNLEITLDIPDCGGYTNDPGGYRPEPVAAIGMAEYNGLMFYAYQTTQQSVRVCSTNGTNSSAQYYTISGVATASSVSATVYGDALTLAFKDDTSNNSVIVIGSTDPTDPPAWAGEDYSFSMNGGSERGPSGAEFNNNYYLAFSKGSSDEMYITCTSTACN